MATKKAAKKKVARKKLTEDPPVVVGGGSSVDVTFLDTATQPGNPVGRRRFRLPNNITAVFILDGIHKEPQLVRVAGDFKVSFF
jgi:hypothetical protein